MSAQVLPKELRLQAPATMPQARSYLFKQQSTQSTYTEGQTIQINLPRLQRSYLTKDSYLKFGIDLQYKCSSSSGAESRDIIAWDTAGAMGLIDKIEIFDYLGSTLLESTSGHGQLMALLLDMSVSNADHGTHYEISSGTKNAPIKVGEKLNAESKLQENLSVAANPINKNASTVAIGGLPVAAVTTGASFTDIGNVSYWEGVATYWEQREPICGEMINEPDESVATGTATIVRREYALPLFSFLGVLSSKYAPLHNGYTINITLNSWATALGHTVASVTGTYVQNTKAVTTFASWAPYTNGGIDTAASVVKDVYFCSQVLELGPVAESMLLSSTGGQPLVIPTKAYRNYVGTIKDAEQQFRLDLNLNVASLTNIMFIMRDSRLLNHLQRKSLSGRCRNYLSNWYFQYGSSVLPQTTGISARGRNGNNEWQNEHCATEAYAELMKSRHKWVADSHDTVIDAKNFEFDSYGSTADYVAGGGATTIPMILSPLNLSRRGTFAGGLDLELVSGRSNDLICGMNTNGMNTSIYLNFDSNNSALVKGSRLDAWCEYDAFVNISPGIATTVSF